MITCLFVYTHDGWNFECILTWHKYACWYDVGFFFGNGCIVWWWSATWNLIWMCVFYKLSMKIPDIPRHELLAVQTRSCDFGGAGASQPGPDFCSREQAQSECGHRGVKTWRPALRVISDGVMRSWRHPVRGRPGWWQHDAWYLSLHMCYLSFFKEIDVDCLGLLFNCFSRKHSLS